MKFYGVVKEIVKTEKLVFILCTDLNLDKDIKMCSMTKENTFGGLELKVDDKFKCEIEDVNGKFYRVTNKAQIYKPYKKKKKKDDLAIRLGNAVTIATEYGYHLRDVPDIAAEMILPVVDRLRDELGKENPEMDDYALGARLGQCSVLVAKFNDVFEEGSFEKQVKFMFTKLTEKEQGLRKKSS